MHAILLMSPDAPTAAVRVLTVDDQPIFRAAARALIGATPGFEVVAELGSSEDAVARSHELCPDLVLLDVGLGGRDGLETARRLAASRPAPVIVLMSADDDPVLRASPEAYGAAAFLTKQELRPRALRALWDRLRQSPRRGDEGSPARA